MDVKRVKITNRKQFDHLVQWMEKNPKVAKGQKFCKAIGVNSDTYEQKWANLSVALNSRGPPTRSVKEWQRVWNDYKLKIKKKLVYNKREANATGGGPNTMKVLAPTEEAVVKLMSLDKTVNHSGTAFGLNRRPPLPTSSNGHGSNQPSTSRSPPRSPQCSDMDFAEEEEQHVDEVGQTNDEETFEVEAEELEKTPRSNNIRSHSTPNSRQQKRKTENRDQDLRFDMLTEQTRLLKNIVEHTAECARYSRKMYKLREEEFNERKKYWLQKQKDKQDELNSKVQLLRYKKKKLDLLERKG